MLAMENENESGKVERIDLPNCGDLRCEGLLLGSELLAMAMAMEIGRAHV